MTLPRKTNLVQELVYIDGQDEPVLMTVDKSTPQGGALYDIKVECMRRARVRKYREKQAKKQAAENKAHSKAKRQANKKAAA